MKKIILLIAALAGVCSGVAAQDTISTTMPSSNYFIYQWPWDSVSEKDSIKVELWENRGATFADQEAYLMVSPDTLTIYGLATALDCELAHLHDSIVAFIIDSDTIFRPAYNIWVLDSTYDSVYDYFRLYDHVNGHPEQIGNDLKIHLTVTPISYYQDFNVYTWGRLTEGFGYSPTHLVIPVYEVYFDEPQTVVDSFYVGREYHCGRGVNGSTLWTKNAPVLLLSFSDRENMFRDIYYTYYYNSMNSNYPGYDSNFREWSPLYMTFGAQTPFLFPILTPPDTTYTDPGDTTIVNPDDSLGISSARNIGRFVSLSPNPASKKVTVLSSFGMSRVEVFSTAGTLLMDEKVSGLKATLDISPLPAGTYLLRITTPMGAITKKLLVQ